MPKGNTVKARSVKQRANIRIQNAETFAAHRIAKGKPCPFSWWLDTENFYALAAVRAKEQPRVTRPGGEA